MEKQIIEVTQDVALPGSNIVLEEGDRIKVVESDYYDSDTPDEDDMFITDSGPLGGRLTVSVEGKVLGEYRDSEEMERAINQWMRDNQFWPTIWRVSDHGNIVPYTLD